VNDLLVGANIGKNNQDSQIQNITYAIMYSSKKRYMYNGSRAKPPEAREFSRIFVSNLQSVRLLLTASYRKMGEQDVLLAL